MLTTRTIGTAPCGFEDFAALGAVDGIAWFGLHKGRDEDSRSAGAFTIDPLGAEIRDYGDTAAILTQLDLVIAVDTAIVHLAGALGKAGLDAPPVCSGLALAARAQRFALVSDNASVSPTPHRRLGIRLRRGLTPTAGVVTSPLDLNGPTLMLLLHEAQRIVAPSDDGKSDNGKIVMTH